MKNAEQRWSAEHGRQFDEHYGTVRGHVRREVTRHNLQARLEDFLQLPRHIIDVGGGRGSDARWLAQQHHEVVLVDPDESALSVAYKIQYPVLEDILHGTAETALAKYGPNTFDLVLSHGRLLYSDSPRQEISELSELIAPGGFISIVTAGKFGKINRFKETKDKAALSKLLLTGNYINNLGLPAAASLPKEVEAFLRQSGLETVDWFGVRIYSDSDDRPLDEVPAFHRNRILKAELEASADPLLRPQGQLLHFIARKNLTS